MSRIFEAMQRAKAAPPDEPTPVTGERAGTEGAAVLPLERPKTAAAPVLAEPVVTPPPSRPAVRPSRRAAKSARRADSDAAARLVGAVAPTVASEYRRMAAVLLQSADQQPRAVMVTSALPGEGKTLTAANLALTLAETFERRVLLIDADMRRPALPDLFDVSASTGLSECLDGTANLSSSVTDLGGTVALLSVGQVQGDPVAHLSTPALKRLIDEARQRFDFTVVDTPPAGLLPDAGLIAAAVDDTVLVVRANSTPHAAIVKVVEALDRERIAGVVLNQAAAPGGSYDNYGGYYAGDGRRERRS